MKIDIQLNINVTKANLFSMISILALTNPAYQNKFNEAFLKSLNL